ncbi:MAG TPA: cell division protein FtsZ, partial [Burkholderiaceae bacterium]
QAPLSVVQPDAVRRTGTDNMPVLNHALGNSTVGIGIGGNGVVGTGGSAVGDFPNMAVPSVWRHGRTAAAKVEALSSNGMDEIEIPAFLRKQAD